MLVMVNARARKDGSKAMTMMLVTPGLNGTHLREVVAASGGRQAFDPFELGGGVQRDGVAPHYLWLAIVYGSQAQVRNRR